MPSSRRKRKTKIGEIKFSLLPISLPLLPQKKRDLTFLFYFFIFLLKQKLKEEEVESHRHFETWQGFWGRPGHGAPKALSQREKLELLLYRVPSRRLASTQPPKIQ